MAVSTSQASGASSQAAASRTAACASFGALVVDVRACTACQRMTYAHVLASGNGPLEARVLFVAEAAGRRGGAITGVPLTRDEAAKRFAAFLAVAGIDRHDAFITNAVLCNPIDGSGHNRPPSATEIARCRPFLARTLDLVPAPVVVALGRVALETLRAIAPHDAQLASHAGRAVDWNGRALIPMYHPGRQSTLHRPHEAQARDWRRLAAIIAERIS